VIPVMLYYPAKVAAFTRECLRRQIAVVVVGFPATPLLMARARFCISACHSKEDLLWALDVLSVLGSDFLIKYGKVKTDDKKDDKQKKNRIKINQK